MAALLLEGCATLHGPRVVPAGQETAAYAPERADTASTRRSPSPLSRLLAPPPWPPSATADAPPFDAAQLETRIHRLVNEVRQQHGLARLAWAGSLHPVTRAHCRDMAREGYFGHLNRQGEDAGARARRAGVSLVHPAGAPVTLGVGENLSLTHRYAGYRVFDDGPQKRYVFTWRTLEEVAWQVVAGWLQSPGHRANLLSPVYGAEAIGVYRAANEAVFITQNFLTAY